MLSGKLVFNR